MGILKKIKTKRQERHIEKLEKALAKEKRNAEMSAHPFHYGEEIFAWVAPQYIKHEKNVYWYLFAGLLAIILAIWGLFSDAWTFSLVIIVFCAVYYLHHFEHPHDVNIVISEMGIKVGKKVIPFRNIRAFWLYYLPGHVEVLNLLTTDSLFPEISIQLNGQDPVPVRNYLLKQIPEWEGKEESLLEAVLRLLKI